MFEVTGIVQVVRPLCGEGIIVDRLQGFGWLRSRPVTRDVRSTDSVTGRNIDGPEDATGYTSRVGCEGVGVGLLEALCLDARGLCWSPYAPDPA